ncbi:MAG: potassium channel protein [Pelotomaculum sp.]|uniref:Kef-type K+ transport systems, predicted NAD-binding component n=1 Tax=Pelotomaculum thermopropionicum (strain DSM 13744 / JCM 10971 / SI) TaxID=370438 RepID=A5D2A1_PELTS|nr:potassium channel protein [Pelotomaculum sp.]BAF59644.1 kef-type K+ transport systems, predicted NAD-binding component [Pelotomaculum thermopropionicum SI]
MSLRPIIYATLALTLLIAAGVACFIGLENKTFMDALWLTVISITTVGFGDVVPSTSAGRVITMLLVLGGVGMLTYSISTVCVIVLEGHLSDIWGKRKMMKEIAKLNNHIVVCGAGRVGKAVIAELVHEKQSFVVIEKDPASLEELRSMTNVLYMTQVTGWRWYR